MLTTLDGVPAHQQRGVSNARQVGPPPQTTAFDRVTNEHSPEAKGAAEIASVATPPGWECLFASDAMDRLAAIENAVAEGETSIALGSRLRTDGTSGDEVAALLTQVDLRRKARAKFGDASSRMLFTQAGLEQASRAIATRLHAQRFKHAGCKSVVDLGCGIGSESMAFASAGLDVLAVELDPFTARIAEHNLSTLNPDGCFADTRVVVGDAQEIPLDGIDGAFLDPARRTAGHRNTKRLANPDDYSPSLNFAFGLSEQSPTGVKLGPGLDRELLPNNAEAQWVSIDGQVIETGIWFGPLARPGITRSALLLRGSESHELSAAADYEDALIRPLGEYLYEPDGAIIRARLIGLLAEQLGAGMVSEGIAYLTSDSLVSSPFVQAFRIIEQLPSSEKQLKRALAARGIGTLEIKKRGADVDPAALRTRLRLKGPHSATLFLTRVGGKHTALLAERV